MINKLFVVLSVVVFYAIAAIVAAVMFVLYVTGFLRWLNNALYDFE